MNTSNTNQMEKLQKLCTHLFNTEPRIINVNGNEYCVICNALITPQEKIKMRKALNGIIER